MSNQSKFNLQGLCNNVTVNQKYLVSTFNSPKSSREFSSDQSLSADTMLPTTAEVKFTYNTHVIYYDLLMSIFSLYCFNSFTKIPSNCYGETKKCGFRGLGADGKD